jgi:hypothetical protein
MHFLVFMKILIQTLKMIILKITSPDSIKLLLFVVAVVGVFLNVYNIVFF